MDAPAATPVISPLLPALATSGLLLLHTPPGTVLLSVDVPPVQSVVVPVMMPAEVVEFTVSVLVSDAVPQLLVIT